MPEAAVEAVTKAVAKVVAEAGPREIRSYKDLDLLQIRFIFEKNPNPKDKESVKSFTREFNERFHTKSHWKSMRRILTSINRKKRRSMSLYFRAGLS
jgi:hypothetical protein